MHPACGSIRLQRFQSSNLEIMAGFPDFAGGVCQHVSGTGYREGGDRCAARQGFQNDKAERVGETGEYKNIRA